MYYPTNLNILIIILLITYFTQHKKEIKIFINGLHWEWQLWVGKKKLIKRLDFVYKTLAHQATYIVLSMCLDCTFARPRFFFLRFFFFFFSPSRSCWPSLLWAVLTCTVHGPINYIFSNFSIKNVSHSTIYTFKNYFATVFSVSVKISSIQMDLK